MCRNDFVFYDKNKSSYSINISLLISQECVASLSMSVSTGCCGNLPCKVLDVHFVRLAPRSKSSNAFSGTSTRVGFRSSACYYVPGFTYCLKLAISDRQLATTYQASHTALCLLEVWVSFLHVITHAEYRLAVLGRYIYSHTAAVFSGQCDPFNHRC